MPRTRGWSSPLAEPELEDGWVDAELAEEFPGLALRTLRVEARNARTPPEIKQRLALLSDRFRGATAIQMRRDPIPSAYRVFYRQVGLDPDATRTPIEEAAIQRLIKGRFGAEDLVADAQTIALVETGVPIWAADADALDGPLGLRTAREGERIGRAEAANYARAGQLVVADATGPIAVLFDQVADGAAVTKQTGVIEAFTVQVPGVPAIFVEEAFWNFLAVLATL